MQSLGATLTLDVTASTTHVVARRNGTDKCFQAWQHNDKTSASGCGDGCGKVHVVSYEWFLECARRWARADEAPFEWERAKNVGAVRVAPVLPKATPPPEPAASISGGVGQPSLRQQERERELSEDDAYLATLAEAGAGAGAGADDGSDGSDGSLGSSDEDDLARMIEEELEQQASE